MVVTGERTLALDAREGVVEFYGGSGVVETWPHDWRCRALQQVLVALHCASSPPLWELHKQFGGSEPADYDIELPSLLGYSASCMMMGAFPAVAGRSWPEWCPPRSGPRRHPGRAEVSLFTT